ncbi:MAG: molecular chaperone [Gammaproteobacteria bacterium]|nr:molecular chaperone [Gammaproteobacteria bacterium]
MRSVRGLDRECLPSVTEYFGPLFGRLRFNSGSWAQVRCVFHDDHHASLSIHRERGAFRCFARGVCGGDVIAFEMSKSDSDFKRAVRDLGAWV